MGNFCEFDNRIALLKEQSVDNIVSVIADGYMTSNPECEYEMCTFPDGSFKSNHKGAVIINLDEKYPFAKQGDYVYVATEITKNFDAMAGGILVKPYGAVTVFLNGKKVFASPPQAEGNKNVQYNIQMPWKSGKNLIVFKIKKLADGFFGAEVSSNSPKWAPLIFDFPSKLKKGTLGFAYSELINADKDVSFDLKKLDWFPKDGNIKKGKYVAWSQFLCDSDKLLTFSCTSEENIEILIDKKKYAASGKIEGNIKVGAGIHNILICGQDYSFKINQKLNIPGNILGSKSDFIYVPYSGGSLASYSGFYKVFNGRYWKTKENADIRPCLRAQHFGKWSYPLGVVLTGLYRAGKNLKRKDIVEYVKKHVLSCVRFYDYSIWDMKTYGYANLNQQLLCFNVLDDFGSFGALLLEVFYDLSESDKKTVLKIAKRIANHIIKKEIRREDGAFYRIGADGVKTMWADDLYMCVPFLLNYSKITGDEKYMQEAIDQILLYKEYLFIPEENLLSHIYSFNMNADSKLPWGRGNGWAIYSLAKVLEAVPENHKSRNLLEQYFNSLASGYIKHQSSNGYFRQLINYPDSYEETSCTSMILYSLSSALLENYAEESNYERAADAAYTGLVNNSIDLDGNIYGICRGSYCSFDADYYKNLLWCTNDPHGIGIIILALLKYKEMKGNERK